MTTDQLIAEITSGGMAQYDESGLIDYTSLRRWIKSELKRFGSNLMDLSEAILKVENNQTKLPENFWQLNWAIKCEASHYETEGDEVTLQNSFFFKERTERDMEWNNASETYENKDIRYIREDYYFKNSKATFYYNQPHLLKLTKGFNKSVCSKDCKNFNVRSSPYEINITGDYINTNFKEGIIYLRYYGLLTDDSGDIIIPETQHDRLQEYLIYYCRMRILEDLVTGDDDANKINLLQYYNQKQQLAFGLAMTEAKMTGLGKNWASKIRNKIKAQTLKYEVMIPTR